MSRIVIDPPAYITNVNGCRALADRIMAAAGVVSDDVALIDIVEEGKAYVRLYLRNDDDKFHFDDDGNVAYRDIIVTFGAGWAATTGGIA